MKVVVRYLAQLRHAAGTSVEHVELPDPCAMPVLVGYLAERHGGPLRQILLDGQGGLQPSVLLFVGDEQVCSPGSVELKDGDVVTLLSPMAGG